ncbi:unnamed protein product, partial [Gulo gulo]
FVVISQPTDYCLEFQVSSFLTRYNSVLYKIKSTSHRFSQQRSRYQT